MFIELTDFDKKVFEIMKEFELNNFTCEPYEVIQVMGLRGSNRDFRKVERAFAKINSQVKAIKRELYSNVSRN